MRILCGLDRLDEIYTFSENRKEYFKNELGIESTPPRATFGRILSLIDGDEVGKAMCEILTEQLGTKGEVVAETERQYAARLWREPPTPHFKTDCIYNRKSYNLRSRGSSRKNK